ncbi:hypothetical protein, partial [Pseudomonas sp. PS01299]|uniref:hypothetical protein n=1 Tax=Pseudomonas sp. PS01299 TaxID=2991435 RepID=UPI00249B4B68
GKPAPTGFSGVHNIRERHGHCGSGLARECGLSNPKILMTPNQHQLRPNLTSRKHQQETPTYKQ